MGVDRSDFVPARFRHLLNVAWTAAVTDQPMGDRVAAVAEPVAGFVDARLGTHLVGCGGCAQARDALNHGGQRSDEPGRPVV